MIKLTQYDGRAIHIAPAAIAQVTEADPREWLGIKAVIVTFQAKTLEVREAAGQVVAAMEGAAA